MKHRNSLSFLRSLRDKGVLTEGYSGLPTQVELIKPGPVTPYEPDEPKVVKKVKPKVVKKVKPKVVKKVKPKVVKKAKPKVVKKAKPRIVSEETRRKLAEASTGVRHSEETKKKLSDIGKTKTGMLNNNFKGWWEVDDVRYESLMIAEAAISVKWPTIRKRALSSNFDNYRFIPKDSE